ncbi:unnamed protein product [Closterium sp. Naga37s-1]|nr:unnamed protein product [Closterium sp. Naga37s-1]
MGANAPAAASDVVPVELRVGTVVPAGSPASYPTVSMSMGADAAAAASDVVPAEVRVGTVVLVGSLAQPEPVYFDYNRCVPVPEIAKGASSNGGGMADVLVWWDVFSERTMCNAVQLFASPDCSGAPAAKYQNTRYMSAFKMGASVKSIRCVLGECPAATMLLLQPCCCCNHAAAAV